jgi:hypothetical protein
MMPIYVDLDQVLIAPILGDDGEPKDLIVRPGVGEFLDALRAHGEPCLLSSANQYWVEYALGRLGAAVDPLARIYTLDDLFQVALRLEMIERVKNAKDREELKAQIPALLPPGFIFDDYPVGSWMYDLKGVATGIVHLSEDLWIRVPPFTSDTPDRDGLKKAFLEFEKKVGAWSRTLHLSGCA